MNIIKIIVGFFLFLVIFGLATQNMQLNNSITTCNNKNANLQHQISTTPAPKPCPVQTCQSCPKFIDSTQIMKQGSLFDIYNSGITSYIMGGTASNTLTISGSTNANTSWQYLMTDNSNPLIGQIYQTGATGSTQYCIDDGGATIGNTNIMLQYQPCATLSQAEYLNQTWQYFPNSHQLFNPSKPGTCLNINAAGNGFYLGSCSTNNKGQQFNIHMVPGTTANSQASGITASSQVPTTSQQTAG